MKHFKYSFFLLIFLFIFSNSSFGQAHAPVFTGGHSQSLNICENAPAVSIDTLLAIVDSDAGETETWSVVTGPYQGTLIASYTITSTGDTLIPSGLTYTPGTGNSGTDSFVVSISDGALSDTTTIYVIINPLPSPAVIAGPPGTCYGDTITLTDAVPGGTWSNSNSSVATIDNVTGRIAGITAGSSIISYTIANVCGIAAVSMPFTISNTLPVFPAGIGGLHAVCLGAAINLSDATSGGKWLSSDPAIASIDSVLGSVSGVSAGVASITYEEVNFCASYYRIITVTVDPLPSAITGSFSLCTGVSSSLHDSVAGGSWSSSATGIATVGPYTGVITGLATGMANVTYTVGVAGCKIAAQVTVNVTPSSYFVTGGGAYCLGGAGIDIGLSGSSGGIRYQLYKIGVPVGTPLAGDGSPLDFGFQTAAGSYTIIGTDTATGCSKNMSGVPTVATNPLPSAFTVTGGGGYCTGGAGFHIYLAASQAGIHYQLYNGAAPIGSSLTGTGSAIDFGLYSAPGVYTIIATNPLTGCTNNMAGSATITIHPYPVAFSIIGGGPYCAGAPGVHIGLDSSAVGVNYQLVNGTTLYGSPITGTGVPMDLGIVVPPGTYTVLATNAATGCSAFMPGSTSVTINPLPLAYTVTGGGGYCLGGDGRHISIANSQSGVGYQVYSGSATAGSAVTGTGSPLDLGIQTVPGVYTILAINLVTGCSNTMTGTATISVDSLPHLYSVTGGGSYCVGDYGVYVDLDGSEASVDYQLFNGALASGLPISGSGGPLDLGLETVAGAYTVVATDAITGCANTMAGSATVIVNPVPLPITGADSVYVGATTTLSDATPGGTWSSDNTSLATVGVTGIVYGDTIGRDTIIYTLPTGCTAKVEVTVNYAPIDTSHTGMSHFSNSDAGITVFPNPSAGNLNIKWTGQSSGNTGILITDMLGRVVYRYSMVINEPSGQVQIGPDLKEGSYLLTIRSETINYTAKLLIRH